MQMQRFAWICMVFALAATGCAATKERAGQAAAQSTQDYQAAPMKIRIIVEGAAIAGTLEDNSSARDFASLLPLRLTLTDYALTEKVSDLPRRLTTAGAPAGFDPSVGDIAYYAPWGNLAIFYRDFGYSDGLVKLGVIDSGGGALSRSGATQATIELAGDEDSRSLPRHSR